MANIKGEVIVKKTLIPKRKKLVLDTFTLINKEFMKHLFTIAFIFFCANVFAQDTIYYDEAGTKVTDKSMASHYEIVDLKGNNDSDAAMVRTYYMSGKIMWETNLSYSKEIRHGKEIYWNENGQKIFEANYKEGKFDGERMVYGKDGELLSKGIYREGVLQEEQPSSEKHSSAIEGNDRIFTVVETMPEFPGGQDALFKFLGKNIKYPKKARRKGITGKLYATFVIDNEGNVRDVRIVKGVSPEIDAEALRVLKLMPKWKPGYQNARPVSVQYNLPINFTLK